MTWVEVAGWVGDACFFSRFLVQWIASERARRSVSPRVFWRLSVLGSTLLGVYTLARAEYVLLAGSVINGLIAFRNLQLGGEPRRLGRGPTAMLGVAAIASTVAAGMAMPSEEGPPLGWLLAVMVGQALWSSRFVVQWWASERRGESHFPIAFWWISLLGNGLLLSYALHRRDPILVAGLAIGPFVQVRNLVLSYRARREWRAEHGDALPEYVLPRSPAAPAREDAAERGPARGATKVSAP